MKATTLMYIVALLSVSLAVIFLLLILKPNIVTKEKLEKILGDEAINKLKNAKDENEMKQIIRDLPKKTKTKLKVLLESQDIRDVIKAVNEHIKD